MIRKMNKILPFDWFFIHPEKVIFSCGSSFIGDKPSTWDFTNELVKEVPKNILLLSFGPAPPGKLSTSEFFSGFFFLPRSEEVVNDLNKLSGQIQLLCKWNNVESALSLLVRGRSQRCE